MSDRPPFFRQEREYSCAAACLRMVLSGYDIELSEDDLIHRTTGVTETSGTYPKDVVTSARELGCLRTIQARPSIEELRSQLDLGIYPIVWLRMPAGVVHSVVVLYVASTVVHVHDPAEPAGNTEISRDGFSAAWESTGRLTVLVRK
jgi:ABC-type bacteriocin/lantibiotic exporter with double-glycine peptidase domain